MSRRPASSLTQAELSLLPNLKNCLVNLPSSLVDLLHNINAVVQNVIVELQFKQTTPVGAGSKDKPTTTTKSVYLGWTGMQSQARRSLPSISGRSRDESPIVEIDTTFARLVGLTDGSKVSIYTTKHDFQSLTCSLGQCYVASYFASGSHCEY